ncbi:unnamed protein product [Penicillium viridicatum]
MNSNGTYPACPQHCNDPNAWKGQVAGAVCGLAGLAMVLGTVIWLAWFHAQQARLRDPQRVITGEYLEEKKERKKEEKKGKTSWWQFWEKKECLSSLQLRGAPPPSNSNPEAADPSNHRNPEAADPPADSVQEPPKTSSPPRLTILCGDLPGEQPSSGDGPHVQRPDSRSRIEFTAPRGLRLPPPLDTDSNVLSAIKNALKGKDSV